MQRINDKLKSLCKFCLSNLDKPCAWISLGNEYCDRIMDIQSELDNRIPRKDIEDKKKECENRRFSDFTNEPNFAVEKVLNEILNKE